MFRGRLVAIYIAPESGAPMEPRDEATVGPSGIEGDRYSMLKGKFRRPGTGQAVTLVEREAVAAVNSEGDVTLGEHETRRNLVTEGVPLNHLVGRTFAVGELVLRGVRLAEPCVHLERTVGRPVRAPLVHRAGLNCEVVRPAVIRVGDDIEPVVDAPAEDAPASRTG
jgi:MOSC domain-containing protein YiiM